MSKIIGYWYSETYPQYPKPEPHEERWKDQTEWLAVLAMLEIHLDARWHRFMREEKEWSELREKQREQGIRPLRAEDDLTRPKYPTEVLTYRGSSRCRVCECRNGSWEYVFGGFTWPKGYSHYLSVHNVLPDPEFKAYVIDWAKANIKIDGEPWAPAPVY